MKIQATLFAMMSVTVCIIVTFNIILPYKTAQISPNQRETVSESSTHPNSLNCTAYKENTSSSVKKGCEQQCIASNICKNSSTDRAYSYVRQSNFYDLIDKEINMTKTAVNVGRVVSDIVHYTWYGGLNKGNTFRFHHMMAVLSVHKFIKPNKIYFWHDMVPVGEYWTEVNMKVPELFLVFREAPKEIRGRTVEVAEHVTDVVRLEAVMEYGGMYFDLDVMVLKSLYPLFKYDVTMGYAFPGKLCSGIIISKPWADFLKLWHQKYSTFTVSRWNYHSVDVPSQLAEKHPNLIHTEDISLHRPNWQETEKLYQVGNLYDWRRNNYASHLWIRFHNVEHNADDIRTWNTTVGEMWRWINYGDWRLQSPMCILNNVCKDGAESSLFYYVGQLDSDKRDDSPINLKCNITHTERVIPSVIHFTWYCSLNNTFRFHHLISILAAQRFIKPDHILFWHDVIPHGPYWQELTEKVPELVLVNRKAAIENCSTSQININHLAGLKAVLEYGGISLDFDVIVLMPLEPLFIYDVTIGYTSDTVDNGILIGKSRADFLRIWLKELSRAEGGDWANKSALVAKRHPNLIHVENTLMNGPTQKQLNLLYTDGNLYNWRDKHYALHLWANHYERELNAQDIKFWNTTVGELYRYIYYGNWEVMELTLLTGKICIYKNICKDTVHDNTWKYIRLPTFNFKVDAKYNIDTNITHSRNIVPNIVHFTWYGGLKKGNVFRFHHLLAVLAAHKFLKPEVVMFWHDLEPEGPYWSEINEKVPELKLVYRIAPTEIRGNNVSVAEHLSDVVRLEALIEYGGMYFDLDAMVVKPLDPLLKYDVTMGYEHDKGLCNGIIIGKPWADFLRIWHGEYRTFDDKKWAYHSVTLPADLAKTHPNLIHTESESLHRPNWRELPKLYEDGNLYDWRTKNYVVHVWIRNLKVDQDPLSIKTWNTTVGEIFRYIYYDDWRIID